MKIKKEMHLQKIKEEMHFFINLLEYEHHKD